MLFLFRHIKGKIFRCLSLTVLLLLYTLMLHAGKDFTASEFWQLHDYNCHLMDMWSDWAEDLDSAGVEEERSNALSPAAFAAYTQRR